MSPVAGPVKIPMCEGNGDWLRLDSAGASPPLPVEGVGWVWTRLPSAKGDPSPH
jgi:hypothetical protein